VTELAKRASRISVRKRTQNRGIDQSLMDLINTVATDGENKGAIHGAMHPDFEQAKVKKDSDSRASTFLRDRLTGEANSPPGGDVGLVNFPENQGVTHSVNA